MPLNNITAAQLKYYEVAIPAFTNQANPTTWESWDLSASIPSTAKFVEIFIQNITNINVLGVRSPGGIDRKGNMRADLCMTWTCETISQAVERYSGTVLEVSFSVAGYWK